MGKFTLVKTNEEIVGNGRYIIVNVDKNKAMMKFVSGYNYGSVNVSLNATKDIATIENDNTAVCNLINLKSATIIQYTIKGRFMSR